MPQTFIGLLRSSSLVGVRQSQMEWLRQAFPNYSRGTLEAALEKSNFDCIETVRELRSRSNPFCAIRPSGNATSKNGKLYEMNEELMNVRNLKSLTESYSRMQMPFSAVFDELSPNYSKM
jgi:hypothetical protein